MTPETPTVAAIAARSLAAAEVLERHGIDYTGEASVPFDQACGSRGLDPAAVLAQIELAATPGAPARDWSAAPLRDLMRFLEVDDHAFIRGQLELIGARMRIVAAQYGANHPGLARLPEVFDHMSRELEQHMRGEEADLFPAIERYLAALESGQPLKGSPLAAFGGPLHLMEQEHEAAGAALRLMREFCMNYNVPERVCLRYRMLIEGLARLEERLAQHMYLENTVLYPRAASLRPSRRWQELTAAI